MAKKWLNIVVDGNITLASHWPIIISKYLEKISRYFMGNYHEEEAYLGLVLYNVNSGVGFDLKFFDWTRDVNRFLEILSGLHFNGNDQNQYVMAEGLAEALMMFSRPSAANAMTTQEYHSGERHCILVATGDPVPRRMQVSVPIIQNAPVVGPIFHTCNVDFLDVAQMFNPLSVSLSVIAPNAFPIFGVIFNLGNNNPLATTPISNCNNGQFTILLSRNFQGACDALQQNRVMDFPEKTNVESINPTITALPNIFSNTLQDQSSSAYEVAIENPIPESPRDVRLETIGPHIQSLEPQLVLPNASNPMHDASSSSQYPMNMYDELMAELCADKDISTTIEKLGTFTTLEEDYSHHALLPFDDISDTSVHEQQMSSKKNISMDSLEENENTFECELREGTQNISENQISNNDMTTNSYKEVNIPPQVVPKQPISSTGKGSSTGLLQDLRSKRRVMNPIHNSGNSSNATPQTWYHPRGMTMMNTSATLGMVNPQGPTHLSTGASFGNVIYPYSMGNSLMEFQPNLFPNQLPMFPYAGSQYIGGPRGNFLGQPMEQFFSGYQYQRNSMTSFVPLNTPTMGASNFLPPMSGMAPMCYQGRTFPAEQILTPPSLSDFQNYVNTWEGSLVGKIHSNRVSVIKVQAFRRATTPSELTFHWGDKLEMGHFIPEKAMSHTQQFSHSPMDYVFFRIVESNNTVDLHYRLSSKRLCAKIDVAFQAIILSPTENKYLFIGTIFPGDTMFVEPVS